MWTASIASQLVVVDTNPEFSDMVNPRGEIYGEAHFILLTNERGERLIGPKASGPKSRLAQAIQRALDKGYDPTKSVAWHPWHPVYGSDAHDEMGMMTRGEMEMLCFGRTNEWE